MDDNYYLYADYVNIVEENTDTMKKNAEALLDASKEVSLEVNPEKTNYMLLSVVRRQDKSIA
jgi:hypothetical protein